MNTSKHLANYLSYGTQMAYAQSKAGAGEDERESPKPATPQLALLRRIKKVVFSPTTKTLEQALEKFETIVDSLDENDDETRKPAEDKE